jgi:hypothetical protein
MLDRNRYYAIVYGDPVQKFYQDSTFYKGDGTPCNPGRVPTPDTQKPQASVVELERQMDIVEHPDEGERAELLAKLGGMHISKIKALAVKVAEANDVEPPAMKGKGLKNTLIAYIADNTK